MVGKGPGLAGAVPGAVRHCRVGRAACPPASGRRVPCSARVRRGTRKLATAAGGLRSDNRVPVSAGRCALRLRRRAATAVPDGAPRGVAVLALFRQAARAWRGRVVAEGCSLGAAEARRAARIKSRCLSEPGSRSGPGELRRLPRRPSTAGKLPPQAAAKPSGASFRNHPPQGTTFQQPADSHPTLEHAPVTTPVRHHDIFPYAIVLMRRDTRGGSMRDVQAIQTRPRNTR